MKKIILNVFYIVDMLIGSLAATQEKWGLAVWMAMLLILIELSQIHDAIKSANGIKE